jgi:uncharacterized protein (TIGR02611 family)
VGDRPDEPTARPALDDEPRTAAPAARAPASNGRRGPSTGRPDGGRDTGPGLFADIAARIGFRAFIRRHRTLELFYRAGVAVLGVAIMLTGFALIPLPGPGWLIVFAGLALLATEFAWAERLLRFARAKWRAWTQWMLRQSLVVRGLVTLLGLGVVAGVLLLYVRLQGVPGWVPVIG